MSGPDADPLLVARARVLRDLSARAMDTATSVTLLDDALEARQWWLDEWPDGRVYVACLIAQDLQEALEEAGSIWPMCLTCPGDQASPHPLRVVPDLGDDPQWACEEAGDVIARIGGLAQ